MKPLYSAVALAFAMAAPAAAQNAFEVNYGVAVTSDYISKGSSQTDHNPALQGYVEGSRGMFYGGVWSSTVNFPDDPVYGHDNLEIDLYAGVRPTFGDLSVDLSYYRYLYDDSGDSNGELQIALGYPMADLGAIGAELDYDPVNDTQWGELSAELGIPYDFTLSGTVASDFGTRDFDDEVVAWDAGVSRGLGDLASVDLRYYDSNIMPGRAVVTIGLDF